MRSQSKSQIIGREGERWFTSLLPPAWSVQRPPDDFGLDAIVAVGSSSRLSALEFGVQVKSSAQVKTVKGKIVAPRVSRDEVLYWAGKFYPTLLVMYDAKKKRGYFDWISNLVSPDMLNAERTNYYLHIDMAREVNANCWDTIEREMNDFHQSFTDAFHARFELLPIAAKLASLLRNLCVSRTADISNRDGEILFVTAQAWTHIEVVKQVDALISQIKTGSHLERILVSFRNAYFRKCDSIFLKFSDLIEGHGPDLIMMKKPDHSLDTLNELAAMLSECVSGLLSFADAR